jgi:hypothetical protein
MQRTVFVIALCALLAIGCGGAGRFIQKGIDQYERDNYRGALHEWDDLSGSEGSMNEKGLVRYLVYRGLTHYHLDQRSYAIVFLRRGHEAYARGNAMWLKPSTVQEMNAALADLQKNPRGPAAAASAAPTDPAPPTTPAPTPSGTPSAAPAAASTGEALVPVKKAGAAPTPKPAAPAAPAKTASPPTRTAPAAQSTSPK